jgi:hypothetical protein
LATPIAIVHRNPENMAHGLTTPHYLGFHIFDSLIPMRKHLKVGFILLLAAASIYLMWRSRQNKILLQDSFYQLTQGAPSEFNAKNPIRRFYKNLAGSYEAELDERHHKKIDIDSMWNALDNMLRGATPLDNGITYYTVTWADAKGPTEKQIAEFASLAKASVELDSVISLLRGDGYRFAALGAGGTTLEKAKNYFYRPIKISKAQQEVVWKYFRQYRDSISRLLENSLLKRKARLDSVWNELNEMAARATPSQLEKGVPWSSSKAWDFFYLSKPKNLSTPDLRYLLSKMRPLVESASLKKLNNELASLNTLFGETGAFRMNNKIYALEGLPTAEFHSILKAILIQKDFADDALITCYEESVGL